MVLRQTRLTAHLLLATIAALALWSVLRFGPDHDLGIDQKTMPVWQAALVFPAHALIWTLIFEGAARVRRWRRNILRAGRVFVSAWTGTLALILTFQIVALAPSLGYNIDRGAALTAMIGLLLLLRANLLPTSRPAWFNGVVLPLFAKRTDVWRRVHRASSFRLLVIALLAFTLALFAPPGIDPLRTIILLMVLEVLTATFHACWIGSHSAP